MRYFLLFVLITSYFSAHSQVFYFAKDTMRTIVKPDETENYISNFAINTTDEKRTLRWTINTIFKGSLWTEPQVCDNNLCYLPVVTSKTIDIFGHDSTLLKILFQPKGQDTSGYFTMDVQLEGSPDIITAHYIFMASTLKTNRVDHVESVKIFPNPSSDYVQLNSPKPIREIKIINSSGSTVKVLDNYIQGLIPVDDLLSGTYFMFFVFADQSLGVSKLIRR